MKFPFTPSLAYFSLKKNLVGSISVWFSPFVELFSEPEPIVDESDADVVKGGIVGMYVVGDGFCDPFPFCWLRLPFPFPFVLFDWRPKP